MEAVTQTGEVELKLTGSEPGEPNAVERLTLTEHDDFPLEQSQDEMLKNAFDQVCSIDKQLLQSARRPFCSYFAILKERLYQDNIQLSCWYQKAIGKCFSRQLIVISWQDIWDRRQR